MRTLERIEPETRPAAGLPALNRLLATGGTAVADYQRLRICALPKSGSAMSYFELGDPAGVPLLCLHGLSVTGMYFDQFHEFFAERGVRAIAPCLLGGVSAVADTKTLGCVSAEIVELLDAIGVVRFDAVGFSWGTLPLLALLATVPARIRRAGLSGPMLPTGFFDPGDASRMKSDVRMSLAMVRRAPALHRSLMWMVCRLPVSVLVAQFRDSNLSAIEAAALAGEAPFARHLARCIDECRSTGSRFFTQGWRMFLDQPQYPLSAFAAPALQADVRLYVGEFDNVHLPSFAWKIASARCGIDSSDLERRHPLNPSRDVDEVGPYRLLFRAPQCGIWMARGAGRLACILHLKEVLQHLIAH